MHPGRGASADGGEPGRSPGARPMPRSIAAGVQRLEHAELLGDRQGGVVGQHHAAGAEADGVDVTEARCASSTGGDELAIPGMLWCSATQCRR